MRWSNEPVLLSALIAGLLTSIADALILVDRGASVALALAVALGQFAVVVGGGVVARTQAYGPETVRDQFLDAETGTTEPTP